MTRIEESAFIKCSTKQAFDFAMDVKAWTQWDPTMLEAVQTSKGPMGVGTTFRGVVLAMGQRQVWTGVVTGYQPNKSWSHNITSGNVMINEHLVFDPAEGGTRFTQIYDIQANAFPEQIMTTVATGMHKEMRERLQLLKNILEARSHTDEAA